MSNSFDSPRFSAEQYLSFVQAVSSRSKDGPIGQLELDELVARYTDGKRRLRKKDSNKNKQIMNTDNLRLTLINNMNQSYLGGGGRTGTLSDTPKEKTEPIAIDYFFTLIEGNYFEEGELMKAPFYENTERVLDHAVCAVNDYVREGFCFLSRSSDRDLVQKVASKLIGKVESVTFSNGTYAETVYSFLTGGSIGTVAKSVGWNMFNIGSNIRNTENLGIVNRKLKQEVIAYAQKRFNRS